MTYIKVCEHSNIIRDSNGQFSYPDCGGSGVIFVDDNRK